MNEIGMPGRNRREFCGALLALAALVGGCGDSGGEITPPSLPGGMEPGEAAARRPRRKAYEASNSEYGGSCENTVQDAEHT